MNSITAKELKQGLENNTVFLLDIREPYECNIASIGGLQIPMADIPSKVNEIDRSKKVVVMCRTGKRAEAVANLLLCDYQFTDIAVLTGGIESWILEIDQNLEMY